MEQEYKQIMAEIIDQMVYEEGFGSNKHPFHNLCKARDIGFDSYAECLKHAHSTANSHFVLAIHTTANLIFVST